MKQESLDERQLWLRGEVFKHSLILMGFMILLKAFLAGEGILLIDEEWAEIFIVSIVAAFGNVEMSLKGAFDFDNKRMWIGVVIMGLCGLVSLLLNIIYIMGGDVIISDGQLTKTGAFLVMSLAFLAMPTTYFLMQSRYRKWLSDL